MQVSELLEKRGGGLFTIDPEKSVADLIEELNAKHVGALVVVDSQGLFLGVVSERAILRTAYDKTARTVDCKKKVRDIMRKRDQMPTVTMASRVREAMKLMQDGRTRHLVVVDDQDKAVGCFSIRDIVEVLLESAENENRELQNFMYGY